MRMICHGKGEIQPRHKTFSLLPHMLVPYQQIDIDVMLETLKHQRTAKTIEQTKAHISKMGIETDIPLENNQIHNFRKIFTEAFDKLNSVPELKQQLRQTAGFDSSDPIGTVVRFIDKYQTALSVVAAMNITNIVKLAHEFFFHFQTEVYFDRHFLFGSPSQRR